MAAIPNGERSEINSQRALDVARDAEPVIDGGASDGHDGFEAGDLVEVTPSGLGRCPVAVHFPKPIRWAKSPSTSQVVITKVDSNR